MKKAILLALALIVSTMVFSQSKSDSLIKRYSIEKWGTDYVMIKYEIEKQTKAREEVLAEYSANGCTDIKSDVCDIIVGAFSKWMVEGTEYVDWAMASYEMKKQLKAFKEI